jgi:fatty acid desaturase
MAAGVNFSKKGLFMPLLTEQENRDIINSIRNMEFKDDRKKVSYWLLRYVCALISVFFMAMTLIAYLKFGGMFFAVPLLLAMCWLLVGIIFHVQWLRYMEITACKAALPPCAEDNEANCPGGKSC